MAKDKDASRQYYYAGPHPEITLRNALGDGVDLPLVRDEVVELPAAIGDDLVQRGKLKAVPPTKGIKTGETT